MTRDAHIRGKLVAVSCWCRARAAGVLAKVIQWTLVAVESMVAAGHVEPPVAISDALYGYLLDLYVAGLTPVDAPQAAFATYH
jgi:hypothetical protein